MALTSFPRGPEFMHLRVGKLKAYETKSARSYISISRDIHQPLSIDIKARHCSGSTSCFLGENADFGKIMQGSFVGYSIKDRKPLLKGLVMAVVKKSPKRMKYAGGGPAKGGEPTYLQLDPSGLDSGRLKSIADMIINGAVGVIPTDTVYAIVCDLQSRDAVDRLYRVKNMDPKKPLSILCRSFQDIDTYTMGFPSGNSAGQGNVFRAARQCLPGPYTFILKASKAMPKQCTTFGVSAAARCAPRKSVGVRIPDDAICQALLALLPMPLLCTSVTQQAAEEWLLDPAMVADMYTSADGGKGVDFVVDGGIRLAEPSTVVDMTGETPIVLRAGKGPVEEWMRGPDRKSTEASKIVDLVNPYALKP